MEQLGVLADALRALGAILEDADHTEYIVVVGGVAMNLRGYAARATTDVDVIARRRDPGAALLIVPEPLPGVVADAIQRVARDFQLEPDWMNTVVAKQWLTGLPPALAEELEWHRFGALHVGVPGRATMIALKLFAAIDRGPRSVHMQDLLRLEPSDEELESAAAWVGTQDASEVFLAFIPEAVRYVRESRGSVG